MDRMDLLPVDKIRYAQTVKANFFDDHDPFSFNKCIAIRS